MNKNDVFECAYKAIRTNHRDWGYDPGNEVGFAHFVAGIIEICDELLDVLDEKKL